MIGILDWQDGISNWDDKWMWQVESVFFTTFDISGLWFWII